MTWKYSQKFMEKFGDIVHQNKWLKYLVLNPIWWRIDWRNRQQRVNLSTWIKNQVINSSDELIKLSKTLKGKNDDTTIINILKWVNGNIKYVGDMESWSVQEKWQTAQETYDMGTGDCEDMHILCYVLARLAGIPYYQLRLICGNVVGGGHCWLIYSADYDGSDRIIDACYWFSSLPIPKRKLYINDEKYLHEWFSFNERKSYGEWTKGD